MPDPRSVMKEFRFLDQKRQAEGLSADEELRYGELRDLVGGEASGPKARPGFDVSAAAARLRESLMPAGLRNRPPPTPEPSPEPLGEIEPPAEEAQALETAYAEQPFAPVGEPQAEAPASDAFFDPGTLAADGEPAAAYDPNAPYDPNAAAYDPNAQPYDPNAAAYDPNAQPYDPNAAAYDPNAAAYDPNAQPYDPNAAAYDPNAQPYDPNAATYDPNAQPYDPNAAAAYDPNAAGYDPNAFGFDPNAPVQDPNAVGWADAATASELDPNAPFEPGPEAATAADGSALPNLADAPQETDWSSVSAEVAGAPDAQADSPGVDPAWAPAPGGEYDASSWDAAPLLDGATEPEAAPAAAAPVTDDLSPLPPAGWSGEPEPDAGAAPRGPIDFGGYDEVAAPTADDGQAALDALLPFDPAAEAAVGPEMARAFGDGPGMDLPGADVPDHEGFHAAESMAAEDAPGWQPEPQAIDQGFELASGGSFDAAADAAAPEWAAPADAGGAPWEAPAPGGELAPPDDAYETAAVEPAGPAAAGAQLLDFSGGELTSDGGDGQDLSWSGAAAGPPPAAPATPAPEFGGQEAALPPLDLGADPEAPLDALAPLDEEIPTIDAVDILDAEPLEAAEVAAEPFDATEDAAAPEPAGEPALLPPEPPPELAPVYAAEPPLEVIETTAEPEVAPALPVNDYQVHGTHRVVVHTLEGQVKRGVLEDADLAAPELPLSAAPGGPIDPIPADRVKAIFFMLAPGEQAAQPYGSRVRVTFRDGRQVAGLSPDYREGAFGFFMTPADARTSTARIWVYAAAVRQVSVS